MKLINNQKKPLGANLASSLREQHGKRSLRVIKGDTVKIVRGDYRGVEGKIERVRTNRGTVEIEGVQREKIKGGNVKVQIHSSNIQITSLKTDDKLRFGRSRKSKEGNAKDERTKAKAEIKEKPKTRKRAVNKSNVEKRSDSVKTKSKIGIRTKAKAEIKEKPKTRKRGLIRREE